MGPAAGGPGAAGRRVLADEPDTAPKLGQLLTAQAGHPPVAAVVDKPHVTGFESGAAAAKEFAQLGTALLGHAGVHSGIGLLDHGVQYEQAWSALPVPVSVRKRLLVRSGGGPGSCYSHATSRARAVLKRGVSIIIRFPAGWRSR